jgi:hypothetical protein
MVSNLYPTYICFLYYWLHYDNIVSLFSSSYYVGIPNKWRVKYDPASFQTLV